METTRYFVCHAQPDYSRGQAVTLPLAKDGPADSKKSGADRRESG